MTKKSVEDYLMEGIHGPRRPLEEERRIFLGTLRERIVLALTVEQVMTDSGIQKLSEAMKKHPQTKLLLNGQVSYRFSAAEKEIAREHNIPYTVISHEIYETDIGAVLTYDHAINKENIFLEEEKQEESEEQEEKTSLFDRIKQWFS